MVPAGTPNQFIAVLTTPLKSSTNIREHGDCMKWFWLVVKAALELEEYDDFVVLWEIAHIPFLDDFILYRFYMNWNPDEHIHDFKRGVEDDE